MMFRYWAFVRKFFGDHAGPTAVEYAVMLSLVLAICIPAIRTLGTATSSTSSDVANALASSGGNRGKASGKASGKGNGKNNGKGNGKGNNTGS